MELPEYLELEPQRQLTSCPTRALTAVLLIKPNVGPTTLILVDEADRLQMNSLEMIRSIFDKGHSGMVLIGMPGIESALLVFGSSTQESG
jgi:DNA transposition AAA+ family ATPase